MADTADMIRMSKMMTGTAGEGAGKGVSDADIARVKRMMAERGMSDMEKSNATTDMGAEKAGMLKRLMRLMLQETGNISNSDKKRAMQETGNKLSLIHI